MNLIKSIGLLVNNEKTRRRSIIERLVKNGSITMEEAIILADVSVKVSLNIDKVEVSSGASLVVGGDNNATEYR